MSEEHHPVTSAAHQSMLSEEHPPVTSEEHHLMTSEDHHFVTSEEHHPVTSKKHHPVTSEEHHSASEEHHPARLRRQEKDSKYLRQIKSRNFLYLSVIMNRFVCASSAVNSSIGVPVFSSPRFFTPRIS